MTDAQRYYYVIGRGIIIKRLGPGFRAYSYQGIGFGPFDTFLEAARWLAKH